MSYASLSPGSTGNDLLAYLRAILVWFASFAAELRVIVASMSAGVLLMVC